MGGKSNTELSSPHIHRRNGLLWAANLIQRGVPPLNVVGSCDIPLVFIPEDRVRRMTVRVVTGLPYGLILGAAFLGQHGSVLNFAEGGGFKPAPESPWVPLYHRMLDALGNKGDELESDN